MILQINCIKLWMSTDAQIQPQQLAHCILFTKPPSNVPLLQWGRKHEEDAFVKYCSLIDKSAKKAGFVMVVQLT